MAEIRFSITEKLNSLILEVADELGVDKSDYVKGLILEDLKKQLRAKQEREHGRD